MRIFDDRIEIWGVGPLLKPLKLEDLKKKHKSILRNHLIGKCFFLIKFIEEWGTGTNRIVEECLKHGLPEPLFEEITESLVIIFRKYKTIPIITSGTNPTLFIENNHVSSLPVQKVIPINTIGSGDAFTAGISSVLASGGSITDAVMKGHECGARNAVQVLPGTLG